MELCWENVPRTCPEPLAPGFWANSRVSRLSACFQCAGRGEKWLWCVRSICFMAFLPPQGCWRKKQRDLMVSFGLPSQKKRSGLG